MGMETCGVVRDIGSVGGWGVSMGMMQMWRVVGMQTEGELERDCRMSMSDMFRQRRKTSHLYGISIFMVEERCRTCHCQDHQ